MKKIITLFFALGLSISLAQNKNQDFHLDKEYKIDINGTLILNCAEAEVFITGSSRKTAHVKIDREFKTGGLVIGKNEFNIDVLEQNGNLEINERPGTTNAGVLGYQHEKYTINIDLPEGAGLIINGDDGNFVVKSLNGTIDIQLDNGDLDLIACKGNDFKLRIDDGDLKMDEGKGRLEIDADDADIEIQKSSFSQVKANIHDGDFILKTLLIDNGSYFIASQDGRIAITVLDGGGTFDVRRRDGHFTTTDNFTVVDESAHRTQLSLGNGNAKVEIRANDAAIRLSTNK